MNMDAAQVVDVTVVEEEVEDVAEAEVVDEVTIPIHYFLNMLQHHISLTTTYTYTRPMVPLLTAP